MFNLFIDLVNTWAKTWIYVNEKKFSKLSINFLVLFKLKHELFLFNQKEIQQIYWNKFWFLFRGKMHK